MTTCLLLNKRYLVNSVVNQARSNKGQCLHITGSINIRLHPRYKVFDLGGGGGYRMTGKHYEVVSFRFTYWELILKHLLVGKSKWIRHTMLFKGIPANIVIRNWQQKRLVRVWHINTLHTYVCNRIHFKYVKLVLMTNPKAYRWQNLFSKINSDRFYENKLIKCSDIEDCAHNNIFTVSWEGWLIGLITLHAILIVHSIVVYR